MCCCFCYACYALTHYIYITQSAVQLDANSVLLLCTASSSGIPLLLKVLNRFHPTSTLQARIKTAVAVGFPLGFVLTTTALPDAAAGPLCTLLIVSQMCAAVLLLLQAYSDMTASVKLLDTGIAAAVSQSQLIRGRYSKASVLYCAFWVSLCVLCIIDRHCEQCLIEIIEAHVPLLLHILVAAGLKFTATAVLQSSLISTSSDDTYSKHAIEQQQYPASLLSVVLTQWLALAVLMDTTSSSQQLLRAALAVPAAAVWLLLLQSHSDKTPQSTVYSRNGHALCALYATWCLLSLLETTDNPAQMPQWRQLFEVAWLALTAYGCIDTVVYAWRPEQYSTQQQLSWRTLIMAAVPIASSVYTNTLNYACALIYIWMAWRSAAARKAALSVI
jgi:hypothetical protein